MSMPNNNPFVMPGMGQHSDLSGNPLMASMEMMRQAWAGLTGPGGLAQALPMTPPMNLEDLERRISELRSVEGWLRMNLSMLSSTIQGMEVQRSTIATLRSFADSLSSADRTSGDTPASPLEIVLGLRAAPKASGRPAAQQPPASASASNAGAAGAHAAPGESAKQPDAARHATAAERNTGAPQSADDAAAQTANAAQAWWDMLQKQFTNIAAATAATMPSAAGSPPSATDRASARSGGAAASGQAPSAKGTTRSAASSAPSRSSATRGAVKPAANAAAKSAAARKSPRKRAPVGTRKTASKKTSS